MPPRLSRPDAILIGAGAALVATIALAALAVSTPAPKRTVSVWVSGLGGMDGSKALGASETDGVTVKSVTVM